MKNFLLTMIVFFSFFLPACNDDKGGEAESSALTYFERLQNDFYDGIKNADHGQILDEKVPLHEEMTEDGVRYVVDASGEIIYDLRAPSVFVDIDEKSFSVNTTIDYCLGCPAFDTKFDGVEVECDCRPRTMDWTLKAELGPDGGSVPVPWDPFWSCRFRRFITDSNGDTFFSDWGEVRFIADKSHYQE